MIRCLLAWVVLCVSPLNAGAATIADDVKAVYAEADYQMNLPGQPHNKWPGETDRAWGRPITMPAPVRARVDALWEQLGL